jgi:heme-degrading monooxygenase HmoA
VSEHSSSSLVFDAWDIPDGNQMAVLERIRSLAENASGLPGFVETRLYESVDHRKVLAVARFASVADRQRALEDPEVATALRELRALASQRMSTYELIQEFHPPKTSQARA